MGTLQAYIDRRKKEGKKNKTVIGALATVRWVLNLSARLWRDEHGLTWLESAPLIQLLPLHDARRPYPLSWEEQHCLFKALPDHLSRMCLFKVNTGCRDGEVCSGIGRSTCRNWAPRYSLFRERRSRTGRIGWWY